MYIRNQENIGIIDKIALKPNTPSEKIKEAIIEMNIMREKKITKDELIRLIEN